MLQLKPPTLPNNSSVSSSVCVKHSLAKIASGKVCRLIVSKRLKLFDCGLDVTFTAIHLTSPIVLVFRLDTQTTIFQTKCPFFRKATTSEEYYYTVHRGNMSNKGNIKQATYSYPTTGCVSESGDFATLFFLVCFQCVILLNMLN